jgi:hypothetical protein
MNARQRILLPTQNYERGKALPAHVPATLALWQTQLYPRLLILTSSCRLIFVVDPLTVPPSTAKSIISAAILRMYRPAYLKHWGWVSALASLSNRKMKTLSTSIDYARTCARATSSATPPPRKLNFPKLYVKSPDWVPDNAQTKIELALMAFETATNKIFKKSRQVKHVYNLHPSITKTLRDIQTSQRFCVTATDKNLGPAILDMDLYIAPAHADHLGNTSQYLVLSKDEAHALDLAKFRCILKLIVDDLRLDKESTAFFTKKLCDPRDKDGIVQMPKHLHLPYFYLLPKVHKTPWKTRPVISGVSSVNEPLSKWIDIQLQRVVHLCPVYLKDSWQLLRELCDLPTLPSEATCFTADAVSMYTNIDNSHGIATIGRWLELHRPNLPSDFPSIEILEGLDIIMRNNIFVFGSHYFKQCNGTAMGTPCACTYATIYYSYHEETSLLQPNNNLLFYRRLIDDALIIQRNIPDRYEHFMQRMNSFGDDGARLEWESPGPSRAVDFLDLHIKLNPNGSITTST